MARKIDLNAPGAAQAVLRKAAEVRAKNSQQLFSRVKRELSEAEWDWFRARTHPRQFEFLRSDKRFKSLLTCRRWGKTTNGLFEVLVHDKKFPGSTIFYIVPDSKSHARRLFWRPFMQLDKQLGLGLNFHETDKRITTPNGTDILLFGAHDKDSSITLRGDQSGISLAILDECKDFGAHFEELVIEAVVPALRDYGGTLILQGSAGNILDGIFYKVTSSAEDSDDYKDWHRVVGRVSDNTFLAPEERDEELIWRRYFKPFGVMKDSPRFRREIKAEWCTDSTERVYLYDSERNHYDFTAQGAHGLPIGPSGQHHEWMFVLGLDLGERDANAFVVFAFAMTCKNMFAIETYARSHMSIDEIYAKYRELEAKYGGFLAAVADTGGYGRGIVTELQNRLGLPLESADKKGNKLGNIALMNNDFTSGRLLADRESKLAKEWLNLSRKIRPSDQKVLLQHSDLGDAALYAWRACQAWASSEMEIIPLSGTPEYWIEKEKEDVKAFVESRQDAKKALSERKAGNW